MKMKSAAAVSVLALSAFALPAAAQVSMSSVYVGASVGQSKFKDACSGASGAVSCDDTDTAWRLLAGYQINRNFAAEIGYHDLGEVNASAGPASASIKAKAFELVGIGAFPVLPVLSIYGKLGGYYAKTEASGGIAGFGSASSDDNNTGLTYGAGVQWDVLPNLGVRGEWQRYDNVGSDSTSKGDIDVISVGAIWRFR
jgi:OmpA-OmpF porin, OOP family